MLKRNRKIREELLEEIGGNYVEILLIYIYFGARLISIPFFIKK